MNREEKLSPCRNCGHDKPRIFAALTHTHRPIATWGCSHVKRAAKLYYVKCSCCGATTDVYHIEDLNALIYDWEHLELFAYDGNRLVMERRKRGNFAYIDAACFARQLFTPKCRWVTHD